MTGGPDLSFNGASDAFIAKVRADGSGLAYCGFIGGKGTDRAQGVAVDSSNRSYLIGYTASSEKASFPVTIGPDREWNGNVDAFIAKIREDDFPWPAFLPAIMEGGKKK